MKYKVRWWIKTAMQGKIKGEDIFEFEHSPTQEELFEIVGEDMDREFCLDKNRLKNFCNENHNADVGVEDFGFYKVKEIGGNEK